MLRSIVLIRIIDYFCEVVGLSKKTIYLDYAATTPTRKEVLRAAMPYLTNVYGNPSSFHSTGLEAKNAVMSARKTVAEILHAKPSEIIFTGSGTESLNHAIKGIAFRELMQGRRGTIITQVTEHHATLEILDWLGKNGFKIVKLKPTVDGLVREEDLERALEDNKDTILVTIMYANNEIGAIQPIRKLADIAHKYNVVFHTDACQGAEYLDINVENLGVDMMTLNGSKIYAFKGTGILYKKEWVEIETLIHGGGQERGARGGTENVAGIVAIATALELAEKEKKKESERLRKLRDYLIERIEKEIPFVLLNGSRTERLPNNVNFSFIGVEGESVLLRLNEAGIRVSTGSACSSRSLDPSHVIVGIREDHGLAHGSIRFSLGYETKKEHIDYTVEKLKEIIPFLRQLSAVWREMVEKEKISIS